MNEQGIIHDSDYSFSDELVEEDKAFGMNTTKTNIGGDTTQVGDNGNLDSNYAKSEDFQSCSSTDEDDLIPSKPMYSEVNDDVEMKDPKFKIEMKFRNFQAV